MDSAKVDEALAGILAELQGDPGVHLFAATRAAGICIWTAMGRFGFTMADGRLTVRDRDTGLDPAGPQDSGTEHLTDEAGIRARVEGFAEVARLHLKTAMSWSHLCRVLEIFRTTGIPGVALESEWNAVRDPEQAAARGRRQYEPGYPGDDTDGYAFSVYAEAIFMVSGIRICVLATEDFGAGGWNNGPCLRIRMHEGDCDIRDTLHTAQEAFSGLCEAAAEIAETAAWLREEEPRLNACLGPFGGRVRMMMDGTGMAFAVAYADAAKSREIQRWLISRQDCAAGDLAASALRILESPLCPALTRVADLAASFGVLVRTADDGTVVIRSHTGRTLDVRSTPDGELAVWCRRTAKPLSPHLEDIPMGISWAKDPSLNHEASIWMVFELLTSDELEAGDLLQAPAGYC